MHATLVLSFTIVGSSKFHFLFTMFQYTDLHRPAEFRRPSIHRKHLLRHHYIPPVAPGHYSQMLWSDRQRVHVHSLFEPPLLIRDRNVVPAHMTLFHLAIRCERPVLQIDRALLSSANRGKTLLRTSRP